MKYLLESCQIVGHATSIAHVNRGDGPHTFERVSYPRRAPRDLSEGPAIRMARRRQSITLGEFARAMGWTVAEASAVENGEMQLTSTDDLLKVLARIGSWGDGG